MRGRSRVACVIVVGAVAVIAGSGCGSKRNQRVAAPTRAVTAGDGIIDLLPDGAQVVIEIDVARLKTNAMVGEVVGKLLGAPNSRLAGAAGIANTSVAAGGPSVDDSAPFSGVDEIVLAAYGVGTSNAATLTVLATKRDIPGARRIDDHLVALGPPDWVDQLAARAATGGARAPDQLLALRARAMPAGATGAALRVTARLAFDARVSLARQLGVDGAPAQLSAWADVADDFAMIVDADAADPGDKDAKATTARLATTMRRFLASVAAEPMVRSLGVLDSLRNARVKIGGTWVRTILAIGPEHLRRVVGRADALLGAPASSSSSPPPSPPALQGSP